jgi:glycosyltransferase involved in cell wall biosynthesis
MINGCPSVAVVIPLYNHAKYISECIQSVLNQTSPVDEIILIDDGSRDNGFQLAQKLLGGSSIARVLRQENCGAHETLNRAIGLARSEFIAVLNSDDLFEPTKIERCRDLLSKNPDVQLVCGAIGVIDSEGVRIESGETIDWLGRAYAFLSKHNSPLLALLNENFVATTSNMVFRRNLWRLSSGFQDLRYCHDLDFLAFAYANGHVLLDLDYQHILYRVHPSNTIKEGISKVRLEIAAVLAYALSQSGMRLFEGQNIELNFNALKELLNNKQMTNMVCYFQSISNSFPSRQSFYKYVNSSVLHLSMKS